MVTRLGLVAFALLLAMGGASYLFEPSQRFTAWIAYGVLLVVFTAVAGKAITGQWKGLFIDSRNRVSLSRFQMTLWTLLILPTLLAIAIANILSNVANPLAIHVPEQIWLVLGISTTSLVGSPLLLSSKANQPVDAARLNVVRVRTGAAIPPNIGVLAAKDAPSSASWTDLFTGEEVGNFRTLDLARVQMFFFTLVMVGAYAVAVGHLLYSSDQITSLPAFDSSMAALLAISHAGYLGNKVVPHTQS